MKENGQRWLESLPLPGTSKLVRIHGPYVSEKEIERIVDFVKKQAMPAYDESISEYHPDTKDGEQPDKDFDEKYDEAVELVTELGQASISLVQRYLKVGYNRAARRCRRAVGSRAEHKHNDAGRFGTRGWNLG